MSIVPSPRFHLQRANTNASPSSAVCHLQLSWWHVAGMRSGWCHREGVWRPCCRGRRVKAQEIWELIKASQMNKTFNGALWASGGSHGVKRNRNRPNECTASTVQGYNGINGSGFHQKKKVHVCVCVRRGVSSNRKMSSEHRGKKLPLIFYNDLRCQ